MQTIRESAQDQRENQAVGLTEAELDEVLWYIDDALSLLPELFGQPTDQPGIYAAPIQGNLRVPAIVIY
jgi:hypothetical protein